MKARPYVARDIQRASRTSTALAAAACLSFGWHSAALADGSETLGPPSIPIAAGNNIVVAGTGLRDGQPAPITIAIPAGAAVNQVLLYWHGSARVNGDDTIEINGTEVTGTLIGGPTPAIQQPGTVNPVSINNIFSYRADITDLGLIGPGSNTVSLGGLSFGRRNDGAGILAIIDDGTGAREVELRDGLDWAWFEEGYEVPVSPDFFVTVPQTFSFTPASYARTASIPLLAAGVGISGVGGDIATQLAITIAGSTTTLDDVFFDVDGSDWDSVSLDVTIPAGVDELTLETISPFGGGSISWIGAGISVPLPGEIGDTVFCDYDLDGIQDGAEPGIPGVAVLLSCDTANGVIKQTATTDADGKYLFTGLPPGTCTVLVDVLTLPSDCNLPVPGCPPLRNVDLAAGESYLDADFCFSPPVLGRIGDTVFCDLNRDGIQNGNDQGIEGVSVSLKCIGPHGSIELTATTASDGSYLFEDIPAGVCFVTVDPATAPSNCNVVIPNCPITVSVDLGPGESYLDADFCFGVPDCPLELAAFCKIPRAVGPSDGDDCSEGKEGKPIRIEVLYTAEDCSATSHTQASDKVQCVDYAPLLDDVYILATNQADLNKLDDKKTKIWFSGPVSKNDTYEILPSGVRDDKLGSKTFVYIFDEEGGTLLQMVEFHTSCSQPLAAGNQFGANVLFELSFKDGRTTTIPDAPDAQDDLEENCEIALGGGVICPDGEKIFSVDLLYTAEGCDATSHSQKADKVSCVDFAPLPDNVYIVVSDEEQAEDARDGDGHTWFAGEIAKNDLFTVAAANAGEDELKSSTYVHIFESEDGPLLQASEFHTSCSQPLNAGDQFGGVVVFGAETEENGSVALGAEITFVYQVTNTGDAPIENVTVTDGFGEVPGSPIPTIGAGDTVVLERTVSTVEDIINEVSASLDTPGDPCEVNDVVLVTILDAPLPAETCDSKIAATLLTYIGPDISGPTVVEFKPKTKDAKPVIYNLQGGLGTGDTLSMPSQNNWTIDGATFDSRGKDLGAKLTIVINGVEEVIHTSCSVPYVALMPAPLDNPKGQPSTNWFVESFREKN